MPTTFEFDNLRREEMVRVVQHLLSNSGRPPRVVCLDWAWQLKAIQQKELAFTEDVTEVTTVDREQQFTWNDIAVGEDGELCVEPNHAAGIRKFDQVLREVLSWCEQEEEEVGQITAMQKTLDKPGSIFDLNEVDGYLRQATLAILARSAVARTAADFMARDSDAGNSLPTARPLRSKRGSSNRNPVKQMRGKYGPNSKTMGLAVMVVLVAMGAWVAWSWLSGVDRQQLAIPTNHSMDVSAIPELVQSTQAVELLHSSNLIKRSDALRPENDMPQADNLLDQHGLASLQNVGTSFLDALQAAKGDVLDGDIADGAILESGVLQLPTEASGQQAANEQDLLATLAAVTKDAESAQTETEIATLAAPAFETIQPPFQIPTIPMLQLQKLPASYQVRATKPAWLLRIQSSQGFRVDPAAAQLISAREVATWIIRNEKEQEQEFQTMILVQAQLAGVRGTSIKWRIVAGAQDLPQVALPLGPKYLDAMQHSLSQFTSRLQFQVDSLQALAASDGLASGVRSSISAQRRELQSQLKIAARILEIVADANQMEGWLDGQLEVHAQFLDLVSPDSPALLQLGEFPSAGHVEPAHNAPQAGR